MTLTSCSHTSINVQNSRRRGVQTGDWLVNKRSDGRLAIANVSASCARCHRKATGALIRVKTEFENSLLANCSSHFGLRAAPFEDGAMERFRTPACPVRRIRCAQLFGAAGWCFIKPSMSRNSGSESTRGATRLSCRHVGPTTDHVTVGISRVQPLSAHFRRSAYRGRRRAVPRSSDYFFRREEKRVDEERFDASSSNRLDAPSQPYF